MAEPASGPQRSRPASVADGRAEKEKRKRSRVTPEQLVHLERFFAMDRSPTAARRKEISDMLGMQERQTQIWFQNRRAKAKLQDGKKGRGASVETPPETPPLLATGYQEELHSLLHEDEPITIIHCTDLSVGTWRRIATSLRKHDLVAYLCDTKRCLTWFIHSSGYGFKMEIPFDSIVKTEFTNATPGSGLATFILSRPPIFYLESFAAPDDDRSTIKQGRYWKRCADWTEDQQASKVLRHNLVGSAVQLAHVLRHLNEYTRGSDIRLHSPSYHPSPVALEVNVQPSPPTAILGTGYHYHHSQEGMNLHQADHIVLARRRSFPSAIPGQQLSVRGPTHLPIAAPSGVVSEPDLTTHFQYSRHSVADVTQTYSNYSALANHTSHSSLSAVGGSCRGFSPQNLQHRPYSASSAPSLPCEDDGEVLSYPVGFQPPESGPSTPYGTPSPPLLTTPFYPGGPTPSTHPVSAYDVSIPVISALPHLSNPHINS